MREESKERCNDTSEESKNKRGRSNGKSSSRRKRGKKTTTAERGSANKPSNFPWDNALSWYTRYPRLSEAVSKIQFPYRPGMVEPFGNVQIKVGEGASADYAATYSNPGVLAINWFPSYGHNAPTNSENPLTVASIEVYARIRSEFSGDLAVDPPDIMLYELAIDSIYALIAKYKRIFRCINAFSPDNYVTPNGILVALGFSNNQIAQLRKEKMEIWKIINTLVAEIGKFRCPGFMDVMNRHYWLSDNIYTDAPSIQGQFYVFNMTAFYKVVTQTSNPEAPPLSLSLTNSNAVSYGTTDIAQSMYEECHGAISALQSWTDSHTINGYLRKAFNPADFFSVDEIDYFERLIPVYSEEVLTQIENAVAVPPSMNFGTNSITYNPLTNVMSNVVTLAPATTTASLPYATAWASYLLNTPINIHVDEPQMADIIIATRLTPTFQKLNESSSAITVKAGTEIITNMKLVVKNNTATAATSQWLAYDYNSFIGVVTGTDPGIVGSASGNYDFNVLGYAHAFRMRPLQRLISVVATGAGVQSVNMIPLGDVHNLASVPAEELAELSRICVLSELNAYSINE